MVKWFKKQDIIVTDFIYANKKDLNTINDDFKKYNIDVKTSSLFQRGEYITGSNIFYTFDDPNWNYKLNPTNSIDKSYKKQVYNEVYNMYYNNYNNAYNRFGFSTYDTSNTILNLADNFIALNFNIYNFGDGIQPKSVNLINYSGDIIGTIYDDGYNNLYLSGSYFINKNEVTSSDMYDISYGEYGVSRIISNDSYSIIKYSYKDVKLSIDLECNPICSDNNYTISDLNQFVNVHYLGTIRDDYFTYTPFFDFYYNGEKITSENSYEIGDIITIKLKDDFISNPFNYITLNTEEDCANSYLVSNINTSAVITVNDCEEKVEYIYVNPVVMVTANTESAFCPDGDEPPLTTTITYLNNQGALLPSYIKNTITATLTEENYISHSGDYEYNTKYTIIPSKYNFTSTLENVIFDPRYVNSFVVTSTAKQCGVPDVYDITITPQNISVCEDHVVTDADCSYINTPKHNESDTISVVYDISENSYAIATASVSSSDPSDYVYNVSIGSPARITYTEKTAFQVSINMVLAQKPDTVMCTDDTDEEVLNNITITSEIYGLRSGDSISNLNYTYSVDQTSVTSSLIDNYTISIAPENADDCYKYEVIPVGGTLPITRESCSQPEPTEYKLVLIPNNITVCVGDTPSPSGYTEGGDGLQSGDSIINDSLTINNDTISFAQTPTIISSSNTYYYDVELQTGRVTRINCLTINPECPDVCLDNTETYTTNDINSFVYTGLTNNISNNLIVNEAKQTKDSIKSIKTNIVSEELI